MQKTRLEAFSDGVLAIALTIMVLELKVPHSVTLSALKPVLPVFLSYVLSFIYVGIYWNNHHHLLSATEQINGKVLWANLHLLFWLSLLPFATAWIGENHLATLPTALYGFVLMMAAVAYYLLERSIIAIHSGDSLLHQALGKDKKGQWSVLFYTIAIVLSFYNPLSACALYVAVAAIWFIPDPRIEKRLNEEIEKQDET
jgi:uncharacterized membrane protein